MQRDRVLLDEMIEAAERIVQLVGTMSGDEVAVSRDRRDAVLWNFAVLGEAAGQVSATTRARYPEVGWRDPVRVRNRIIHGYAIRQRRHGHSGGRRAGRRSGAPRSPAGDRCADRVGRRIALCHYW